MHCSTKPSLHKVYIEIRSLVRKTKCAFTDKIIGAYERVGNKERLEGQPWTGSVGKFIRKNYRLLGYK